MLMHGGACVFGGQPVVDGDWAGCSCHNKIPEGPKDRAARDQLKPAAPAADHQIPTTNPNRGAPPMKTRPAIAALVGAATLALGGVGVASATGNHEHHPKPCEDVNVRSYGDKGGKEHECPPPTTETPPTTEAPPTTPPPSTSSTSTVVPTSPAPPAPAPKPAAPVKATPAVTG